jgi:thioredoxin-dependent peroxiredoxin
MDTKTTNKIQVLLNGKPVTLIGRKLKIGKRAPNFYVVDKNLKDVNLHKFNGQIKIISSFISLDTPVCDSQVKEFNKIAGALDSKVTLLNISKDLPFAEIRFCAANDIKNGEVLSDYKYSSFGINFGLLIKENNLLARAVVILDSNNFVRYMEIVKELTTPPNYKAALDSLKTITTSPPLSVPENTFDHCVPCESGTPPLTQDKIAENMQQINGWELVDGIKLHKEFKFKNFIDAKYFLDTIATIAEEQGHHPNFTLIYNKLKITLTTHVAGGLTDNDFFMAKVIDEVLGQ